MSLMDLTSVDRMTGTQKTAVLLMAMGTERAAKILQSMRESEVTEVMVQLSVYGGFPRAVGGMRAARAAFERLDAR